MNGVSRAGVGERKTYYALVFELGPSWVLRDMMFERAVSSVNVARLVLAISVYRL